MSFTLLRPIDVTLPFLDCHSVADNNLTNGGKDMTGVAAIAEALKVNTTLQSVKYAIQFTAL